MDNATLIAKRNLRLGVGAPLFYQQPLQIVQGRGVELEDEQGNVYIDLYNNVPCVGHAHPYVVDAQYRQAGTLNVHSRYLHEDIVRLADRLCALHDANIESVVFACSGTEANEVAMTMARIATGGQGFICSNKAYHGNSHLVRQLTHVPTTQTHNANVRSIPFPESFRPLEAPNQAYTDGMPGQAYLAKLDAAIADFQQRGVPLAALLVCSIFANEGLPDIPEGFMQEAAKRVHAAGGLVIADEVQAGYCRTGTWWGYDASEFKPDIVVTGKPMGNGLPLSACAASQDLVNQYRERTRYFNTFASSPLQAAAGNAVLDVIENEGLESHVADLGAYLKQALVGLMDNHPQFADVRGQGLFLALEWVKDKQDDRSPDAQGAVEVVNQLKDKGFLTSNAGAYSNVIKIRPPLVLQKEQADRFLTAFAECL